MESKYDLIVFGATGFTGYLVAEYLAKLSNSGESFKWAIAGRDLKKLEGVKKAIHAPEYVDMIVADASNEHAMADLVLKTKIVITTVGPYQLKGEVLIKACAQAGTDYVDLCGEPVWMAKMIPILEPLAKKSGARIVFSCGFDSIPFDLGVFFLQDYALNQFSKPISKVVGRVKVMKGTFSGGTIASMLASMESFAKDPELLKTMFNPFALTPGFKGPKQPFGNKIIYDELVKSWAVPFVMAAINTKNIHRTNALLNHAWGTDFIYDEMLMTGDAAKGKKRAEKLFRIDRIQNILLGLRPTRWILKTFVLPKPGDGPDQAARDAGRYEILFAGKIDDQIITASVKGDKDPGYGSTSKMLAQSALCLINDLPKDATTGGVWTPGSLMKNRLIKRLSEKAGLTFSITK